MNNPLKKNKKREEAPESSLGTRFTALTMNLVLLFGSACYIPTPPLVTLLFMMTAILGSYLAYLFRDSRPIWLGTLPTVGTLLLFTNFGFEVYAVSMSSSGTAVAAFVHLITGLSALHCFDLRTRTDFSVASLIGLALLTFLTGVGGKDPFFGAFILSYTILAGLLLFFDSSSRSHELGPSRAVAGSDSKKQVLERRLRAISLTSFIPVILLPVFSFGTFVILPRTDSLIDIFIDNVVRSKFPLSAYLSGQLGKGGRSQALRGGVEGQKEGGSGFTVKGGEHGTAGGAGKTADNPKSSNQAATAPLGQGQENIDLSKLKGTLNAQQMAKLKEQLKRDKTLNEAYQKEGIDLSNPQTNAETIIMKVATPQHLYIRKYALNGFDGKIWKRALPTTPRVIKANKTFGFDLTASDTIYVPPALPTLEVKQDFRAETDLGYIIPTSWIPQIVKIGGEELRMDSDATVKATEPIKRGMAFTVISQAPVYDMQVMRNHPLETLLELDEDRKDEYETAASCLKYGGGISSGIKELSQKICNDPEANWFTRAEKIQEYLKKNYQYENDGLFKSAPSTENPAEAIDNFLFKSKTGSCRHFATAHALLCRAQGIPARLVVGYTPGTFNKTTGYNEIRAKDSHVWTEVYIPYWNWVPFDATPPGQLPAHEEGGNVLSKFIRSGLANPFAQEIKSNKKPRRNLIGLEGLGQNSEGKPEAPPLPGQDDKSKMLNLPFLGTVDPAVMQLTAKIAGVIFALALLVVAVFLYLRYRKDAEVKQLLLTHKASTVIYLEVLNELKRYEIVKFPTETVDEISFRLSERFQALADEGKPVPTQLEPVVSNFMQLYNEDRFGGIDNLDELTDIAEQIKALAAGSAKS